MTPVVSFAEISSTYTKMNIAICKFVPNAEIAKICFFCLTLWGFPCKILTNQSTILCANFTKQRRIHYYGTNSQKYESNYITYTETRR